MLQFSGVTQAFDGLRGITIFQKINSLFEFSKCRIFHRAPLQPGFSRRQAVERIGLAYSHNLFPLPMQNNWSREQFKDSGLCLWLPQIHAPSGRRVKRRNEQAALPGHLAGSLHLATVPRKAPRWRTKVGRFRKCDKFSIGKFAKVIDCPLCNRPRKQLCFIVFLILV